LRGAQGATKKEEDESRILYCYKMMEIAARADVETKAVVKYIIDGIDDVGYRKSVLYGAKIIRKLENRFDTYVEMYGKIKSKASENKKKHHRMQRTKMQSGTRNVVIIAAIVI